MLARLLAVLLFAFLSAPAFAQAEPDISAKWCTAMGPNDHYCGASAQAACAAQKSYYAPGAPGGATATITKPTVALCDWITHADGGPIAINPAVVFRDCVNAAGEAYNMLVLEPGLCATGDEAVANRNSSCGYEKKGTGDGPQRGNPSAGNPILIRNGAKVHHAVDWQSPDGLLTVERDYSSTSGWHTSYLNLGMHGLAWRSGFEWTALLHWNWVSNGAVNIILPDGSNYDFTFPGSGSTIYQITSDMNLTFTGNAANVTRETVLSDGGVFKVLMPDSRSIELTLVKPAGSNDYSRGRLTKITEPSGYFRTFAYGANGELTTVTDSLGRSIQLTWLMFATPGDPAKPTVLSSVTVPDGTKVVYLYETASGTRAAGDQPDRLYRMERRSAANALLTYEEYHYEDARLPFALTGLTDGRGVRLATWTYDWMGRATSSVHAGGADQTTIAYSNSPDGFAIRTVTNALGKQTVYRFRRDWVYDRPDFRLEQIDGTPSTNCVGTTRSFAFNNVGDPTETVDEEGRVTHFDMLNGKVSKVTRAYGTPDAVETEYTWHPTFFAPTQVKEPGLTTSFTYSATGAPLTVTETDTTTQTVPYATAGQTRTWTLAYTAGGLLDTVDGPLPGTADRINYDYNATGALTAVTNELGQVTTVTAVDSAGRPTAVTDPNGKTYALAYDGLGRLATFTANLGWAQRVTTVTYDAIGEVTKLTLPDGSFLQYTYDNARRLTAVQNKAGERIEYALNALGETTSRVVKSATGTIVASQTATFDELGRLLKSIGAANQAWTRAYDKVGNVVSITDPRGNVSGQAFDKLNRLKSSTDQNASTTTLTLTKRGDIASHADPKGVVTAYVRNGWGEAIRETSPDSGTVDYLRNQLGLVTQKTDARGVVSNYAYDAAGRLTGITYPSATTQNVTLSYDSVASGNLGKGQLTGMTDATGSTAWRYDMRQGLASATSVIGGKTYAVAYDYDAAGRLGSVTYPSGRVVLTWFDANGLPTTVQTKKNASAATVDLAYWTALRPFETTWKELTFFNGVTEWRAFDNDGRVTGYGAVKAGVSRVNRQLGYPDGINLNQVWDQLDSTKNETYWYEPANRLQNTTGPWGTADFYYDGVGNRVQANRASGGASATDVYAYTAGTNRVASMTTGGSTARSFTYDAAGNILTDVKAGVTTAYTYDAAGRLATVAVGGSGRGPYLYNGLGLLASRQVTAGVPASAIHMIYDADGNLLAEADASTGQTLREYVWFAGRPIAVVTDVAAANPTVMAVHVDHLDRPVAMTDAAGTTVWRAYYKPFGEVQAVTGPAALDARFPGQWFMAETGLSYNWHRWYDASLGRYTQPDPLGLVDGPSRYAYARNSPLVYVDPDGENAVGVVGGFIISDASIPDPTDAALPKWAFYGAALCTAVGVDYLLDSFVYNKDSSGGSEHTKGARPSTKPRHEAGQARKGKDYGGEKGDERRRPQRKPPNDYKKGPWPPRDR